MKGKIVFSMKTWPYLIDDEQRRHNLRPMVRGICGGIVGLLTSLIIHSVFDPYKNVVQFLLYALVYGLMFSAISVFNMGIACFLGKAGCKVFCQDVKE